MERIPKLSLLAFCIYSCLGNAEELNLDFIKGTNVIPSILTTDSAYPAGQYSVDVLVNKNKTGKMNLVINADDEKNGSLCFTPQWLKDAGVLINPESYKDVFDEKKQCYVLTNKSHTSVYFDYGSQSLSFNIPQAYMLSKTDPILWDYGINGGRLRYHANFNKASHSELSAFGNFDLGFNIGKWVLSSNTNIMHSRNKNEITSSNMTLSTAISQLQSDFVLGKSQTRTELFSDFGFYGAALRTNKNMRPWENRGYAPDISGVVASPSRITVKQNGYVVYSRMVPAGPYHLTDLRPMGNGNLIVSIEDENGHKTETEYPVTTLPTLLRPGEFQYDIAVGKKDKSNEVQKAFSEKGVFGLGSIDYGFSTTTLNIGSIIHENYQGAGIGFTQMLGTIGAMSFSANMSKANYDNGEKKRGGSYSFKYAKSFSDRTDLQILTYRYQTPGYIDFANFDPKDISFNDNQKSRYEARLSHNFDNMYLTGSYWRQNYWNRRGYDEGGTLSLSTTFLENISVFINGSYSHSDGAGDDNYSASLGMSIPFDFGGRHHYSSNTVGYSSANGTTFNTSSSATVNDRFNYSINANTSSKGDRGASASTNYAFDTIQTSLTLSQSKGQYGKSNTSISGNFSGSVLGTSKSGVIFTKEASETVGIVHIPGVKGVSVNGSMPTNKNGYTAVWLSEYSENNVSINMENVPDNVDFKTTNWKVVPTENAIVYRDFDVEYLNRYILRVKGEDGKYLTGGNALTEQGVNAGFISNNGVLLMNLLSEPKKIRVNIGDNKECSFSANGLKPNTNQVQDVTCR